MEGHDLKRTLATHDLIARIYKDDRFPPPTRLSGDLRMFAITITWVIGVERAPKGERVQRVADIMHLNNFRFWELIRSDLPRYEPERSSETGLCEAPMIRREGLCEQNGTRSFHVTNPNDGTWRLVSFCTRHSDVASKVAMAERDRQAKGGLPEPLPNRGGLLPCYIRWNWTANYEKAGYNWKPPKVGICADDWPVMARVVDASSSAPPALKVIFGGQELSEEPLPTDERTAPALKLITT